jgi:molecular chaperone GrpE
MSQHDIHPEDDSTDATAPDMADSAYQDEIGEADLPPETQTIAAEEPQSDLPEDPAADQLRQLSEERDQLKDQLLRARAEFENFRKRKAREAEEMRKRASEELIRELLPVVDHLEMALSHVEDKDSGLAKGVEMVVRQFAALLSARGLSPIPSVGERFDPNVHEALTQQPSDEHPEGFVMNEFQRGYRLGEFVLRPAKVVVSSGGVNAPASPDPVPEIQTEQ